MESIQTACADRRVYLMVVIVVCSVCANIGLLLMILNKKGGGITTETRRTEDHQVENLKSLICYHCPVDGAARHESVSGNSFIKLSVLNQRLCCINEAEALITFLNLMMIKSYIPKSGDDGHTLSAHLYLDALEDNNYKWTPDEYGYGAGHISKYLSFQNGKLIIEKTGYYNIYSFITFKRRQEANAATRISHSVKRLNSNHSVIISPRVLLEKIVDLPSVSETFRTSSVSGVMRLEEADELYVDVSHVHLIYRYAPSNFFGLHMIKVI